MIADNPFVSITFNEKDIVVDRVNEKVDLQLAINKILASGGIIVLKGRPGAGKSTLIGVVLRDLRKSRKIDVVKEDFTPTVYNMIRSLDVHTQKRKLVILDDFNNIELIDKSSQQKIVDMIYSMSRNVAMILIENRDAGVEKEFKKLGRNFENLELGGLSKSDLRKIVVNRLNSIKKKSSDSLEPFTEDEYEKIYRKSGGNPRIALLICSAIYDQKSTRVI